MVPTFFEAAVEAHQEAWQTWLNDTTSKKPFVIEADTADVGLAFFCCLAKTVPDATNRILVFDKPGVLPSLVQGVRGFFGCGSFAGCGAGARFRARQSPRCCDLPPQLAAY